MKTVCIVVGHTPQKSGAYNDNHELSEFDFNNKIAPELAKELRILGLRPIIVYRDTYTNLPAHVNETQADICLSLHCNAFDDDPHGSEVLYYHSSIKGKALAEMLLEPIVDVLGVRNRGIRPIDYDYQGKAGDRGGWLVEKSKMVCVIVEPFFIDADQSLELALSKQTELVKAIATGTKRFADKYID